MSKMRLCSGWQYYRETDGFECIMNQGLPNICPNDCGLRQILLGLKVGTFSEEELGTIVKLSMEENTTIRLEPAKVADDINHNRALLLEHEEREEKRQEPTPEKKYFCQWPDCEIELTWYPNPSRRKYCYDHERESVLKANARYHEEKKAKK
jgi:hypothetical protein